MTLTLNRRENRTMPALAHTTNRQVVAADREYLRAEDFDLEAEARELWCQLTDEKEVRDRVTRGPMRHIVNRLRRAAERSCPVVLAAKVMIWLAGPGRVEEWRLQLVPLFFQRVIERCYAGKAQRGITCIDRDEHTWESRETLLTLERRIAEAEGREVTAEALIEEARVNESEAAIQIERARALRRRARTMTLSGSAALTRRPGVAAS